MGQAKGPAPVFRPALEEIQSQTRIPILLPSNLPSGISGGDIKLAAGEVKDDGYFISLYFSQGADNAAFAAGFGGSTRILGPRDLPNTRRVALSGGRTGNVQSRFVRWLLCACKLVVGTERRDVPNPNKAEKRFDGKRPGENPG